MKSVPKITVLIPYNRYVSFSSYPEVQSAIPEGVAIAATLLYQAGFDISCYDLRAIPDYQDKLAGWINESDLVCIAGLSDGYKCIKEISALIKNINPMLPILLGGIISSLSWKTLLLKTQIDYCLYGECELVLIDIVNFILSKKPIIGLPVAYKSGDLIVPPEQYKSCPEFADIPMPDYSLWYHNKYPELVEYSTQRGCTFNCKFCANPWKGCWQASPAEKIESELRVYKENGVKMVSFNDPTFNISLDHSAMVAKIMGKLELNWVCTVRVKPVSLDWFKTIKDNYCTSIFIGIESGSNEILTHNNKGILVEDSAICLDYAHKAGLDVIGFILIGLPGETDKTLSETIEFVRNNKFKPRIHIAFPYPGTLLYKQYCDKFSQQYSAIEDLEEFLLLKMSEGSSLNHEIYEYIPGISADKATIMSAIRQINLIAEGN